MALASHPEAQTYLKFLPLLQDLPKQTFFIIKELAPSPAKDYAINCSTKAW